MKVFLFFLILLVVAGLVAAGGDRMGHLAARRKIRFGKMRPRHVSTLIAVVSGILIALVTSLVLFLVVSDVREALTKYDSVKSDLGKAQLELKSALTDTRKAEDGLLKAEEARDAAVADKEAAVAELTGLEEELSNTRGLLSEAVIQLDTAQREVTGARAEVKQLNTRKAALEQDIQNYENTVETDLRQLIARMGDELEQWETGDLAIPKDTSFLYKVVAAGEGGQIEGLIESALVTINSALADQGLAFSADREKTVRAFIEGYQYRDADYRVVLVFSSGTNVLEGGQVELEMKAVPLTPLVKKGDQVLTVLVREDLAQVSWLETSLGELPVPAEFDEESYTEFAYDLLRLFTAGAEGMGFLPSLATGEVPSPVGALAEVYDTLANHQRPFIVQFVAREPANALDGLAECDIYISKWPPEN